MQEELVGQNVPVKISRGINYTQLLSWKNTCTAATDLNSEGKMLPF